MEAIILAGGLGTRLSKILPDLPKPIAPVAGKPFLWYLLHVLSMYGFKKITLSIGYRAKAIQSVFGDKFENISLSYSTESSPLGTGGAIRLALQSVDDEKPIFILNGDTFAAIDYRHMLQRHDETGAQLTVALMTVRDTARYGAVTVRGDRITAFSDMGIKGPGLINCGVYLLKRSLFRELEPNLGDFPEKFSFETEILKKHLDKLNAIGFTAMGYFIDIGVPEDYERAQVELPYQISLLKQT
jgi:D-glycero-alpha-D-manno-heptose 1-phosphate guanylyltransferase